MTSRRTCCLAAVVAALGAATAGCTSRKCVEGPCCVNGVIAGPGAVCYHAVEESCAEEQCGRGVLHRDTDQYCSGVSSACDGRLEVGPWQTLNACDGADTCVPVTASIAPGGPSYVCQCDDRCAGPNQVCGFLDDFVCAYDSCGGSCCAAGEGCVGSTCATVATVVAAYAVGVGSPQVLALADGSFLVVDSQSDDHRIERHAADGSLLWARAGALQKLVTDRGGNAIAALSSVYYGGTFARLGLDGETMWSRSVTLDLGYGSTQTQHDIAVGADGSVTALSFGTGTWGIDRGDGTTQSLDAYGVLLVRWDGTGALRWTMPLTSAAATRADQIVGLDDGSVLVLGQYGDDGTAVFGPGTASETTLSGNGLYVAKVDSSGALALARILVQQDATFLSISLAEILPASDGSLVVIGRAVGVATLGPGGSSPIALPGGYFIAALDGALQPLWAQAPASSIIGVYYQPPEIARGDAFAAVYAAGSDLGEWGSAQTSHTFIASLDDHCDPIGARAIAGYGVISSVAARGRRIFVAFDGGPTLLAGDPAYGTSLGSAGAVLVVDLAP